MIARKRFSGERYFISESMNLFDSLFIEKIFFVGYRKE